MKERSATDLSARESEETGLPWPKTWKSVYLLVVASFVLWVALLIVLTYLAS
jgi:hypothetical protein